jgi:hypothetical protein
LNTKGEKWGKVFQNAIWKFRHVERKLEGDVPRLQVQTLLLHKIIGGKINF